MCCFAVPGHGWVPGRAPNVLFCCAGLRSGARKSSKCAVLLCRATCGAQEELQMCCFAVPGYVWGPGRAPNVLFCCAGLRLGARKSSKCAVLLFLASVGGTLAFQSAVLLCLACLGSTLALQSAVLLCLPGLVSTLALQSAALLCLASVGSTLAFISAGLLCLASVGGTLALQSTVLLCQPSLGSTRCVAPKHSPAQQISTSGSPSWPSKTARHSKTAHSRLVLASQRSPAQQNSTFGAPRCSRS